MVAGLEGGSPRSKPLDRAQRRQQSPDTPKDTTNALPDRDNAQLRSPLENSERRVVGRAAEFDTSLQIQGREDTFSISPVILDYFRNELGPMETMRRLQLGGPEFAVRVREAIRAGNENAVIWIMELVGREPPDGQNIPATSLAEKDAAHRAHAMHVIQRIEGYKTKHSAQNISAKPPEQLHRIQNILTVGPGTVEKLVQDKLREIPEKFGSVRKLLLNLHPAIRQLVLSDQELLDATEEDCEKWDRLLQSPHAAALTSFSAQRAE
jgi:hypothetical protein